MLKKELKEISQVDQTLLKEENFHSVMHSSQFHKIHLNQTVIILTFANELLVYSHRDRETI